MHKKIAALLEEIDYVGLFSFEYAETNDGRRVFFEFNLRNDGAQPCLTLSGFNLIYYYYCDLMSMESPIQNDIQESKILHMVRHHLSFFHRNISYKEWRFDLKQNDGLFEVVGNDKKPLKHIIKRMIFKKLKLSKTKYYS